MAKFDTIVVGLGAVGSAALQHLARAGASVLGLDRFTPPHPFGSSHGETRVTRAAIGEGVEYSRLALRSNALWRVLEAETGERLFVQCGCLSIRARDGAMEVHGVKNFFGNVEAAAKTYGIPHERFESGAAIRARFPQFAVHDQSKAFLDAWGGYLLPEACIRAQLTTAARFGATIRTEKTVAGFRQTSGGVTVTCADGESFEADRLIVTAGAWLPGLLGGDFKDLLSVTRQVLFWFEIARNASRYADAHCPVFMWDVTGEGDPASAIYGFPLYEGGPRGALKVAHEEHGVVVDPDHVPRAVGAGEIAHMYEVYVKPFFPDLGPRCVKTEVCLYTRAEGSRFIIDRHPEHDRILFASACSGHGFKHSAAVGEALAELARGGRTTHVDIAPFRLRLPGSYHP